jgi:hypothetical protein
MFRRQTRWADGVAKAATAARLYCTTGDYILWARELVHHDVDWTATDVRAL